MQNLHFSGHESFICKQFWLKKGVDFLSSGGSFSAADAVVGLGVGKNMVRAIRYWMRSFGIIDPNTDELTRIGRQIFVDSTGDPYLESTGSVWLLHYLLVTTNHASLYHLLFNDFRRLRPEFTTEHLQNWVQRYCEENDVKSYNANTVKRDVRTLLNNYLSPSISKRVDIEDSFSGLLFELRLIETRTRTDILREQQLTYYAVEGESRESLPPSIFLFSLLDYLGDRRTTTFQDLYQDRNSPGRVFALNQEGLYEQIQGVIAMDPQIAYSETAGNQVLQLPATYPNKFEVLNDYYQQLLPVG